MSPSSLSFLASLPLLLLLTACNEHVVQRVPVPPEVVITGPEESVLFRQGGEPILLTGSVSDTVDPPSDLSVVFTVDDGVEVLEAVADDAGVVGASVSPDDYAPGTHTFSLTATDSDGETDTATSTFQIKGPLGGPMVMITSPEDGTTVTIGLATTFQGQAEDLTDTPDLLTFTWTSSLDGELEGAVSGAGQSIVVADALTEGVHEITLTATDSEGESGWDSILFTVEEEEIIPKKPEPGDMIFTEFMVNPQVAEDEQGEWVELFNTSGYSIDVGGYYFQDNDYDLYILEGPIVVAAGDYLVLCASLDIDLNGGVPCDAWFKRDSEGDGLALANGPDEIMLVRPDGVEIDRVEYDDTWYLPGIAIGVNPLYQDGEGNDDLSHWCHQTTVISSGGEPGTPGQVNDSCE